MKVCITFPVFNGLAYTKNCLASLEKNTKKLNPVQFAIEIVIVDDGSTDGTSDWINMNYPKVHVLEGTGDLWWSGGIDKGIRYAFDQLKADYILWWNNDVIEDENYFTKLREVLNENEPATLIGAKIYLDETRTVIWSMGGIFNLKTGYKEMIGSGFEDGEQFQAPVECDWLTGMGSVIHKSVYERIGELDEKNFPQYHGDADFTLRAHKAGFTVKVDPRLKIYNDTSNSGLKHENSFLNLWKSLFSIKSNFNISKDFKFYKKHTVSMLAYRVVLKKYFTYIGGFFKWKLLQAFGITRNK